ncbi:MAG TPA: hypothetical protein VNM72_14490 [Blastocatellia bacterium]|nr:hypothetical protein [Blastocatellia bacterium]
MSSEKQRCIRRIRQHYGARRVELAQGIEDRQDGLREAIYGGTLDQ